MSTPAPRSVTLVLCDARGVVLGELPAVEVGSPYWAEVGEVVETARTRFALEVVVLRLLTTVAPYAGGAVSYLAQLVSGEPPDEKVRPVSAANREALAADPTHRLWWAKPGAFDGLTGDLDRVLETTPWARTGAPVQRKTWNLSVLLTVPADTAAGPEPLWFKAVPPFLADEGAVIARVARVDPGLVPPVVAHDAVRRAVLLRQVPGQDQWGLTDEEVVEAMVRRWVAAQVALTDQVDDLLAVGAADARSLALVTAAWDLLDRPDVRAGLSEHELAVFEDLVDGLPRRMERVEECGLPDTLVHGDLHPGNWRRDGQGPDARLALLDWGDVLIGNPLLDVRAFVERLESGSALADRVRRLWVGLWAAAVPGSDPDRALRLLEPVAQLVAATTYQRFLDHIEESERAYHRHDPLDRVRAAVRLARR